MDDPIWPSIGPEIDETIATITLGLRDSVRLVYFVGTGNWTQVGPVVNPL